MTPAGQPIDFRARRIALIARMAKDLIAYDSLACERDSIRALFGRGYAMGVARWLPMRFVPVAS